MRWPPSWAFPRTESPRSSATEAGRAVFYTSGWVHVICGCMFCGKTDEMLRLLRRFSIAGRRVILVKPRLDTRTDAHPGLPPAAASVTRRFDSTSSL